MFIFFENMFMFLKNVLMFFFLGGLKTPQQLDIL